MFFRYFLTLCVVAFVAVAVHVSAEDEVDVTDIDNGAEGRANPAVKVVAKLIGSLFTGAAVSCLGEAANNCKHHWRNPGAAMNCGRDFLRHNKGRCAVGK